MKKCDYIFQLHNIMPTSHRLSCGSRDQYENKNRRRRWEMDGYTLHSALIKGMSFASELMQKRYDSEGDIWNRDQKSFYGSKALCSCQRGMLLMEGTKIWPSICLVVDIHVTMEWGIWHSLSSSLTHPSPSGRADLWINRMGVHQTLWASCQCWNYSSSQQLALSCAWSVFLKECGRAFVKEKGAQIRWILSVSHGIQAASLHFCAASHSAHKAEESTDKWRLPQHAQYTSYCQIRIIGLNIIESLLLPQIIWPTLLTDLSTCCKHISSWTSNHSLTWQILNTFMWLRNRQIFIYIWVHPCQTLFAGALGQIRSSGHSINHEKFQLKMKKKFFTLRNRLPREIVESLSLCRYSKPSWIFSCVTCLRRPCLGRGLLSIPNYSVIPWFSTLTEIHRYALIPKEVLIYSQLFYNSLYLLSSLSGINVS